MVLSTHTASGQALGYFFQLERALSWIALAPTGATIGIETEDDVVVKLTSGESIHEQDKSSVNSYPYSTRQADFWKTLGIWLEAIKQKEIDPAHTTFFMVTNRQSKDSLAKKIGEASSQADIDTCVTEIRKEAASIDTEIKSFVQKVVAYSDDDLATLIGQIRYKDGSETYSRDILISDLQIVEDDPEIANDIVDQLIGSVFSDVVESWRAKQPAIIQRDYFLRKKNRLISSKNEKLINDKIFSIVEVTAIDELTHQESMFVKQLELVNADDDEIIEAIHDFLHAASKKTGIAERGYITKEELRLMEEEMFKRWRSIFKHKQIAHRHSHNAIEIGQIILNETMEHNAMLGSYQTRNYFLTRGTYHLFADLMKIGWHPDFKNQLAAKPLSASKEKV